jgi:anionic cell wall polymer biosynthesis LytR-Cps2A-Psr (LCP) family protein
MRAHRRIAIALAFTLSFVMPATSVFAAAAPIDGARLGFGILRFFVQLVGDAGGLFGIGTSVGTPGQPGQDGPIDYGSDGRLTFLLLGMDARDDTVTRTDTVMVMSLKGTEISAASIPRDTKRIPDGSGGIYGKVNSILRDFYVANGSNLDGALDSFEGVIEKTLGIEIDYHAAVWFDGFTTLVEKVDRGANGIEVNIGSEIYDARHHDQTGDSFGVYFPAARSYRLFGINPPGQTGNGRCDGAFKQYANPEAHPGTWCKRALPFVRTRHGSSDYIRGRHQQQFIAATIDAVDRSELNGLVSTALEAAKGKWVTNFPISLESAVTMFDALDGASLANSAVFKPPRFASMIPGQNGIELDLSAIRAWCDEFMS